MNDSFEFSDDESESVGKKLREQELRRCGSLDDSSSSSSFSSSSEDANDRLNAFEKSKLYEDSSSESESSEEECKSSNHLAARSTIAKEVASPAVRSAALVPDSTTGTCFNVHSSSGVAQSQPHIHTEYGGFTIPKKGSGIGRVDEDNEFPALDDDDVLLPVLDRHHFSANATQQEPVMGDSTFSQTSNKSDVIHSNQNCENRQQQSSFAHHGRALSEKELVPPKASNGAKDLTMSSTVSSDAGPKQPLSQCHQPCLESSYDFFQTDDNNETSPKGNDHHLKMYFDQMFQRQQPSAEPEPTERSKETHESGDGQQNIECEDTECFFGSEQLQPAQPDMASGEQSMDSTISNSEIEIIGIEVEERGSEIHPSYYAYEDQPGMEANTLRQSPIVHHFSAANRPIAHRRLIPVSQIFSAPANRLFTGKFEMFNQMQSEVANMLAFR